MLFAGTNSTLISGVMPSDANKILGLGEEVPRLRVFVLLPHALPCHA